MTDEPLRDAPDFKSYATQLSELMVNSDPKFTAGIYGGWGTGKTTLMKMIQNDLDTKYGNIVETVWFDSWRYEGEEYSAMLPLLRSIVLGLENAIEDIKNANNDKKKEVLEKVKKGFLKVFTAIVRNTKLNLKFKAADNAEVGAEFEIGKIIDDYKSDGSFIKDQKRVYLHQHISDHVGEEFRKIRYNKNGDLVYDFRLIIFVDDLDRCTPERALELLESIKTFFDIEGIIYVIGIDPSTIDPIIQSKYGRESKIIGMNYLQKIVQLPFQIPIWRDVDMSNVIKNMMIKTGIKESDIKEKIDYSTIEMIITTAQLNPRDVKRFINSVVLSRQIFGQRIEEIGKLIAVQAFYFRGNGWINVLKLITSLDNRKNVLKNFMLILQKEADEGREVSSIQELNTLIEDTKKRRKKYFLDRETLEFFERVIQLKDNDLLKFLYRSAAVLLGIVNLESYLRVVDSTKLSDRGEPSPNIDTEMMIDLIKKEKVPEFNGLDAQVRLMIHLPCEDFSSLNLDKINLSGGFLPFTYFSGTQLSGSDLALADLSGAKLSKANLSQSWLWGTDFTYANLPNANLHGADLSNANLHGAELTEADLSGANLSKADLSEAILINIVYDTNLRVHEANFENAIIDNPDFIDYLSKVSPSALPAKLIPDKLINKEELRKKLLQFGLRESYAELLVNLSKLPEI